MLSDGKRLGSRHLISANTRKRLLQYLFQQIVCFCLGFGSQTDLAVCRQAHFKEHTRYTQQGTFNLFLTKRNDGGDFGD